MDDLPLVITGIGQNVLDASSAMRRQTPNFEQIPAAELLADARPRVRVDVSRTRQRRAETHHQLTQFNVVDLLHRHRQRLGQLVDGEQDGYVLGPDHILQCHDRAA